METTALRVSAVTKTFPGVTALDEVALEVGAGEVHGVVGENGAGKSTLMAVISGALVPDRGTVEVAGRPMDGGPDLARALGVAIVRQEPALLPDLTVAENLYLKVPPAHRPRPGAMSRWAEGCLREWDQETRIRPDARVSQLVAEERFIVEISAALSSRPKVLILDEPTEHLGERDVERLFGKVRALARQGCAVIYISHRIREVRAVAGVITVLRDGRVRGTYPVGALSESDIVALIIGRTLDATFPAKPTPAAPAPPRLELADFRSAGFQGVNLRVGPGEVVGLAGIEGNGQRETLRALAGLGGSRGEVRVDGSVVRVHRPRSARKHGFAFLPGDRHREGVLGELSVAENIVFRNLGSASRWGVVSARRSRELVAATLDGLAVKAASASAPIASLSGGNQQKAVLGSILATDPRVLLIDEPTQGVDVGSKVEIYAYLRRLAAGTGTAILVVSSDALELAGLCDRVLVFSRGTVVAEVSGAELTEETITAAALTASTGRRQAAKGGAGRLLSWLAGDSAPAILIAAAMVALGVYVATRNPMYLSTFNISSLLALVVPLMFVAMAQTTVMMVGAIDLSVGPLMGFLVVVGSFFLTAEDAQGRQALGWILIVVVAIAVSALNWALVDALKLPPLVATLATFFALQSGSLLLRPQPGGVIDTRIVTGLGAQIGVVPVAFLVAVAGAIALQFALRRSWAGLALRAVGSDERRAGLAGARAAVIRLAAFVGCGLLTAAAAVCLIAQVGSGDPAAGTTYTLTSISAAAIGGASIFGGRGSFLGAVLGALLVQQILGAIPFLSLSTAWESYLVGALTLVAVATFSKSRQMSEVA
ncbi:ATP-binding cassette domain-containing protein [Acrocarpospora sp. B8E8]|uniref:ATP-binding cassette domain-containing protein n=1 Tax=Acrocarpospora sp. B8E8 TaxID=3153572 RepID=UPI00325CE54A